MSNFPETLKIRDTKLYDSMGGLGQRIFTTAGAGYEKVTYIRKDVHDAEVAKLAKENDDTWASLQIAIRYAGEANGVIHSAHRALVMAKQYLYVILRISPTQRDSYERLIDNIEKVESKIAKLKEFT